MKTANERVQRMRQRASALTGAVILESTVITEHSEYGTEYFPALKLKLLSGETLWVEVWRDPEGNGPGHLSGWELA